MMIKQSAQEVILQNNNEIVSKDFTSMWRSYLCVF